MNRIVVCNNPFFFILFFTTMESPFSRTQQIAFVSLLFIAIFSFSFAYARISPWYLRTEEAVKMIQRGDFGMIIDVRTTWERKTFGYPPKSINVPISQLSKVMPSSYPNKKESILVFCMSGQRAKYATNQLHKLGYENVYYVTSVPVV